jgi:hypothetical protein
MPPEVKYAAVPFIYKSKGLTARPAQDEAPQYTYLNLMNCLERAENSMSSRYGTQIINRDPSGLGTNNYYFANPINSLSRLTYLNSVYRYAGDVAGNLWRRSGNAQGPYTNIFAGKLSGSPFQTVVTNCFLTAQSYLFIYDHAISVKDTGTFNAPQLTGIDPSPYTANATPYSPLLTLIDNFASGNTYTSSGFSSAWAFNSVTHLQASSGQTVTDFSEFFGVQPFGAGTFTIAGGTNSVGATAPNSANATQVYSGFASAAVSSTETVSLSMFVNVPGGGLPGNAGSRTVSLDYSINSGATWTNFFSATGAFNSPIGGSPSINVLGLTNLNTLQVRSRVNVTATSGSVGIAATTFDIQAVITAPNVFGDITNGMLTVLNSNSLISIPISSIISSSLVGGIYQNLTIVTQSPHGLTGTPQVSVYGSSNDLTDGFYTGTVTGTTTITVPYLASVPVGSTGGVLGGGAAAPNTAVLTAEYSTPYPPQMSAWGFYEQVPATATSFPVGSFQGTVAQNTTATVGKTVPINLNINNQATDDDLIVLTLAVGDPAAISTIRLQFDINGSGYTSAFYYKDIAPSYYQQNVEQLEDAYTATSQQIFADTLGLLTGQPPNSTTAQLQPGTLSTGQGSWTTIYLRRGDFVSVGIAGESGSDWAAVSGWQLVVTTNTVGSSTVACNGLYFQWGYGPSSFGGVGYDYRYTYYNVATGTESNGSPEQKFDPQFGYLASLIAPTFLRQAVQITGEYSQDPQVTHLRIYRRGGTLSSNWLQIDQVPNVASAITFTYKDVIPDAVLAQAFPLVLDNDPPVTSSLQFPIATTLSGATGSPGSSIYSQFVQQTVTVQQSTANFVVDQIVDIGYPTNLEQVRVITGGIGQFTAIVRLQHNIGEPVNVYSVPRTPCNLCALAYGQVWLAGDPNNPHYLYFSKRGLPESFSPAAYIPVGSPSDPINAIINWRGTLFVGTLSTWYQIIGGAQPYAQPTGSKHGIVSQTGWAQTESAIWYRAADGLREFQGADGRYMTLPVEQVYRPQVTTGSGTQLTPVPITDPTQANQDVMAYYNNVVYTSYISLNNSGQRYRMNFDTIYMRYRTDDVPATAMLWEQDINTLLVAKQISPGNYAICQDQINDYDDGGWVSGQLSQTPINLAIQLPFGDISQPHYPKQWNTLETDIDTQGQTLNTQLLFNTEPQTLLTLPAYTGNLLRNKKQFQISPAGAPAGSGVQAYAMSTIHTMAVTIAPTLYQENIYAAILADYRTSFDTYWLKMSTDESKIVKQCYFDYTSTAAITVNIYADGSTKPYFTFTLPPEPTRLSVRVLFPAYKMRLWRLIAVCAADYQFWENPVLDYKPIKLGSGWNRLELIP